MISRFARPFFGALLTGVFVATISAPAAAAPPHPSNSEWHEERLVQLVNQTRAQHGLGPVRRHSGADVIGQWSANVQAWYGRLGHNPNLAQDVTKEVTPHWWWAGENVGCAGGAAQLHDMWMASSSHRANILRPGADTVGFGAVYARGCLWATGVYVDT